MTFLWESTRLVIWQFVKCFFFLFFWLLYCVFFFFFQITDGLLLLILRVFINSLEIWTSVRYLIKKPKIMKLIIFQIFLDLILFAKLWFFNISFFPPIAFLALPFLSSFRCWQAIFRKYFHIPSLLTSCHQCNWCIIYYTFHS